MVPLRRAGRLPIMRAFRAPGLSPARRQTRTKMLETLRKSASGIVAKILMG
ncbi:MAG: hypothetical protein K0S00_1632, partial [Xanthobacteraceae bacterium]|nr:hypothetical protein [Xanthobacteraceae bacterium]